MSLTTCQNTPAIDAAFYRPIGTLYQLQPSFHPHSTEPEPTARARRAGEEFWPRAPGVELVLGGDALDTFHHLVTAPHLFISFSTFGLAAAVLATQAKIYTAPVGDFASQLAGCWGECDCPEVRRKLTGPHGWPCCGSPLDARAFLARHDPWARFGLRAGGVAEAPPRAP